MAQLSMENRGEDAQVTPVAVRLVMDVSQKILIGAPLVVDPRTGKRLEFAGPEASQWEMFLNEDGETFSVILSLKNVPIVVEIPDVQATEQPEAQGAER
jgi:hypothetical protein